MKKIVLLFLFMGVFHSSLCLNIIKGYFRGEDLSVVRNRNETDFLRLLNECTQGTEDNVSEEKFMKVLDSYLTYEIDELSTILYGDKLATIIVSLDVNDCSILMKFCKRLTQASGAGCTNHSLRYATLRILQFYAQKKGNDDCIELMGDIEEWQYWEAVSDKHCFLHRVAHETLEKLVSCLLNRGKLTVAKELLESRIQKPECCDESAEECCPASVEERTFCYNALAYISEQEELVQIVNDISISIF